MKTVLLHLAAPTLCILQGCALLQPTPEPPLVVKEVRPSFEQPTKLELKGVKGRIETVQNCSIATTKTFLDNELRHKKIEAVDFKVKTTTKAELPNRNIIQVIETVAKDGKVDLHDMAFPDIGEKIEMELTPQTVVKKAGQAPKKSIFYVQPLPLPPFGKKVKVGDEWKMEDSWQGLGGVPLSTKMRAKFNGVKPCGNYECAEIVIDGEVHMSAKLEKKNGFRHHLTGRFLFEPHSGLVPWSEFSSTESLTGSEARAEVVNVLRSSLVEPPGYYIVGREEPACPIETKE